eukprot:UN13726
MTRFTFSSKFYDFFQKLFYNQNFQNYTVLVS